MKDSALVTGTAITYCLNSRNLIIYNKIGNARINVTLKFAFATVVAVEEQ
jgi:hypothetical protein